MKLPVSHPRSDAATNAVAPLVVGLMLSLLAALTSAAPAWGAGSVSARADELNLGIAAAATAGSDLGVRASRTPPGQRSGTAAKLKARATPKRQGGQLDLSNLGAIEKAAKRLAKGKNLKPAQRTPSFRVASFNLLGHSHTKPGGDRKGWANSAVRSRWALQSMLSSGVEIAGLQEFQMPQIRAFLGSAQGVYDAYPGFALGPAAGENSIVWRASAWELVEAATFKSPYFNGNLRDMPRVLLRHRSSGAEVWVLNVHNPADKFGRAGVYRARAVSIQVDQVNQLSADGTPVILTGDFNDRRAAFCSITRGAQMVAADGGSNTGGVCAPPLSPSVDWVFGRGVDFEGYVRDNSALVRRTSDHPLVHASVTLR